MNIMKILDVCQEQKPDQENMKDANRVTFPELLISASGNKSPEYSNTKSLSRTLFSVKPLFKRFKRFEKSLYGLKKPIFESELV